MAKVPETLELYSELLRKFAEDVNMFVAMKGANVILTYLFTYLLVYLTK